MIIREIWNWLVGTPTVGDERSHQRFYSRRDLWEKRVYLWWLYPLVGVYTFGHCASNYPVMDYPSYYEEKHGLPKEVNRIGTSVESAMAGVFWPLYWTWEGMDDADS
jgi:hypothetical protein